MVVTISNLYGAGALSIARATAEALSYRYVDRQLPVVVATRLRISPQEVDENEDVGRSLSERLLTGLERGTPELGEASTLPAFDRELVDAIGDAVREFADAGDCGTGLQPFEVPLVGPEGSGPQHQFQLVDECLIR